MGYDTLHTSAQRRNMKKYPQNTYKHPNTTNYLRKQHTRKIKELLLEKMFSYQGRGEGGTMGQGVQWSVGQQAFSEKPTED